MNGLIDYALERAVEPSTWIGIGSLFTAIGWTIAPDAWMAISNVGMGIGGFAAVILRERPNE